MSYGFTQDVPADEAIYREIKELLPDTPPAGLVVHLAVKREGGLRYVDVWESEEAWELFHEHVAQPAVDKVLDGYGIPHSHDDVDRETFAVVDVWFGNGR